MNFQIFSIYSKLNSSLTEVDMRSEKVKSVFISEYGYILQPLASGILLQRQGYQPIRQDTDTDTTGNVVIKNTEMKGVIRNCMETDLYALWNNKVHKTFSHLALKSETTQNIEINKKGSTCFCKSLQMTWRLCKAIRSRCRHWFMLPLYHCISLHSLFLFPRVGEKSGRRYSRSEICSRQYRELKWPTI